MNRPEKTNADRRRERTVLATPVLPDARGVGVEQRAARTLAALSSAGEVELAWCRPRWLRLVDRARGRDVGAGVAQVGRLEALPGEVLLRRASLRWPRSRALAAVSALAGRAPVARASSSPSSSSSSSSSSPPWPRFHAFRLAAAEAVRGARGRKELDLDDLESEVARMIAELAHDVGDAAVAGLYRALAERLAALERAWVPRFDRVWVGSRADAAWLAARTGAVDIGVLPNVVEVPPWRERARAPGPTRFLFVGALAYYPNIDALLTLADTIVPWLASRGAPFELHVVGRGAPRWLEARLAARPQIVFHGAAPAMAPHYAAADAVVVPLRAGGGTRIKLLEAFALGVPVIASTLGAFGLDVVGGEHLTIADGAEAFTEACARFVADPGAGAVAARAAHRHVSDHHRPEVFAARLNA